MRYFITTLLLLAVTISASFAAGACCPGSTCETAQQQVPDNTLTEAEKAAGWKLLFDGKTFDGWGCLNPDLAKSGWTIDTGAFYYTVQGKGMLYTKERYGDFELKVDFMVDPGTNSGVFFRWDKLHDPVMTGIEMQVLDSAGKDKPNKHDCGAIYDVLEPSINAMKPAKEWNTAIIRCSGPYISVTLNDKRIISMNLNHWKEANANPDGTRNKFVIAYKDMARSGHIGLQDHGGKVWYKNIKIKELK